MLFGIKEFSISMAISIFFFLFVCLEALAGIGIVKDISVGGDSNPLNLTNVNGRLFFTADDGINGRELWKSDGTEAGTVMIKDINPLLGSDPLYLTDVNGTLFFSAGEGYTEEKLIRELWKSDGTEAGTVMVKDLNAGNPGNPRRLTNVNGTLFFIATENSAIDLELWKSDGTEAGTVMVKDINPYSYSSSAPNSLTNVNGILFFSANDGVHGIELWKSDGTEAGTVMVKNINPDAIGDAHSSSPLHLTPVGTLLFFTADDGSTGRELWKSDGTEAGTVRIGDIWGGTKGSDPQWLTQFGFIIVFSADDGTMGRELWGSHLGLDTYLIKDINTVISDPGLDSNPEFLTVVGDTFFFAATAADGTARELWKSNGTEAATVMVKDINPLVGSSPNSLRNVNGTLYFQADDGVNGFDLWTSDGTEAGTVMVKDIPTWAGIGSNASTPIEVNGTYYFVASDGFHGRELWKKSDENGESFPWELFIPAFTQKLRR